jgi:hypothetical protein
MQRTLRARVVGLVSVAALSVGLVAAVGGSASADTASDPRANFFGGNAQPGDCANENIGFPDDLTVGTSDSVPNGTTTADENVSGTVEQNQSAIQTGVGQDVDITILGTIVVIDAVVVKGGNGYNVYDDPAVLPPADQPPQHYISPLNNGGNVPGISHWFVCYHLEEGPTTGNLSVHKTVIPPASNAVVPTSFNVHVDCDSGDFDLVLVDGQTEEITGLPIGDICVVTEDDSLFPALSAVTYDPATANTDGVEIGDGTTVAVNITNDFGAVEGTTVVEQAPVVAAAPIAAAPAFTG